MSDWSMYEFEDSLWDEFHGDHIVPTGVTNTTGDRSAPGSLIAGRSKKKLLGKGSVAYSPSVVLPSSDSDSFKEESGLMLENNMPSRYGVQSNNNKAKSSELCEHDATSEKIAVIDNSCDNYLFNGVSDDNLSFLEKPEDKDPRNSLYYGWTEMGSFEDVDMMFRNCDSTYGFENGTESFSSAYNMGETMDVNETDLKFPSFNSQDALNLPEHQYLSRNYSTTGPSVSSFRDNDSSCALETLSFPSADGMDMFIDTEQIDEYKEKANLQNQSLGKASQFEVQVDSPCFAGKQIPFYASEFNDVEGGRQVSTSESGLTTTAKSGLSDSSTGASSFHQLQLVMEQLDLGTRLCIKDCLYRLAESADQRQKHENLNGDCGEERDSNIDQSGERNDNAGSEDMETNTNPIDRSIAHLLFYTASEPSAIHV